MSVSRLVQKIVRDRRGFTLVEMLVGMAVLGIVLASMAGLLSAIYNTGTQTVEAGTLQDEARSSVDTLVADLRQAYTGDSATPLIASFSSTAITFYSPDRLTPYHLRQMSYRLSGGQFQRAFATSTNTGGPPWTIPSLGSWSTLVGSVTNASILTYKDAANQATTNPSAVASANVKLVITPRAGLGGAGSTYQTNIALRADTCS